MVASSAEAPSIQASSVRNQSSSKDQKRQFFVNLTRIPDFFLGLPMSLPKVRVARLVQAKEGQS